MKSIISISYRQCQRAEERHVVVVVVIVVVVSLRRRGLALSSSSRLVIVVSFCHLCCFELEILQSPEAREDFTKPGEGERSDRFLPPSIRGLEALLGGEERE